MTVQSISQTANLTSVVSDFNAKNGTRLTVADVAAANGLKATDTVRAGTALTFPDSFGPASTAAQTATALGAPSTAGTGLEAQLAQRVANLQEPTAPKEGASATELAAYQQKMQNYTQTLSILTNLQQMLFECRKSIIANFRA